MVRDFKVLPFSHVQQNTKSFMAELFSASPKKDAYLKQLWPLLMLYRLLCRFPFRRTQDGTLETKMFSLQTIIFGVGFIAQTYLILDNVHGIFKFMFLDTTDFADVVTCGLNLCILSSGLFIPFSVFSEWKNMCEMFNKWIDFQDQYKEIVGEDYVTEYNIIVLIVTAVIPVGTFSMIALHNSVLYHKQWYHLLSYVLIVSSICTLYGIWIFSLIEIIKVADVIRHKSYEVTESHDSFNKAEKLYGLRILWHNLSVIVKFSSTAVAYSMIVTSAIGVIIFIASAYGFMQCVALGDERYMLFFTIGVGMCLVLCVPCEIGYKTAQHAGTYIVEMLSSVNMMEQDELTAREVDLFLQAVYANYPDVSYGGMVKINRETITSLLSATFTYLIVLLQLKVRRFSNGMASNTSSTIIQLGSSSYFDMTTPMMLESSMP